MDKSGAAEEGEADEEGSGVMEMEEVEVRDGRAARPTRDRRQATSPVARRRASADQRHHHHHHHHHRHRHHQHHDQRSPHGEDDMKEERRRPKPDESSEEEEEESNEEEEEEEEGEEEVAEEEEEDVEKGGTSSRRERRRERKKRKRERKEKERREKQQQQRTSKEGANRGTHADESGSARTSVESRPSLNLFRSAANERGPSRTRAKVTFSAEASSRPSGEQRRFRSPPVPARVESDRSGASADGKESRPSPKRRKRGTSTWHASHNPLFRADKQEVEVLPLRIWIYAIILNRLWPPFNFFRLHFIYICAMSLLGGIILYLTQLGTSSEIAFVDALFHGISSVVSCGLITTDTSKLTTPGQIVIAFGLLAGNFQLLTLVPVVVRLYYFRKHFRKKKLNQRHSDEYYALVHLFVIVLLYFCAVVGTAWIMFSIYFAAHKEAKDILERNGLNIGWFSLFQTLSGMSNAGYSILSDNMMQFQTYPFPLLLTSFLVLAGNTTWPIMLRLIIRILYHQPFIRRWKHVYKYMLDHPRRCYTHLFPTAETRWLLTVLLLLNSIEFIFEVVMDWSNPSYSQLNAGYKLVNMYFQTIAIRTAGFNSIDVTKLPVAILWLYIGMMYVASTPVAITVRYTGDQVSNENIEAAHSAKSHTSTVGYQAQTIFVRHVVFLFMAVLFICMIEEVPLRVDPEFSVLKVIFEVISAYGPVGLSLGYGSASYSFSGAFSTGAKLVIMTSMILGRHRNLPNSIDSAINIPTADILEEGDMDDVVEIVEESTEDEEDYSTADQREKRANRSGVNAKTGEFFVDSDIEMGQLSWSDIA